MVTAPDDCAQVGYTAIPKPRSSESPSSRSGRIPGIDVIAGLPSVSSIVHSPERYSGDICHVSLDALQCPYLTDVRMEGRQQPMRTWTIALVAVLCSLLLASVSIHAASAPSKVQWKAAIVQSVYLRW